MTPTQRPGLFLMFFVSGFCSLVYQVVWTRLAFGSFGIITPVLSVVISVFMLGLAVGAWAGGRAVGPLARKTGLSAAAFYGVAELVIGLGAVAVPKLFALGENLLLTTGQSDSRAYLALSALVLAVSILPWCLFMGATFPLMMAHVREREPQNRDSFSYLYLANVLGATIGTLLTALVLIETVGFRSTLWVAAAGNFLVAGIAGRLAWRARNGLRTPEHGTRNTEYATRNTEHAPAIQHPASGIQHPPSAHPNLIRWILFWTGFASMAMEVVWIRAFAPVVKTQVYSFAIVVATYLAATAAGSWLYRRHLRRNSPRPTAETVALLCAAAFLPIVVNAPRWLKANWLYAPHPPSVIFLFAGICPFCALLGYLTPSLVDECAGGLPPDAGKAYALNVLGCILGPLLACYVLLPNISERSALVPLGLPFFLFYFLCRKVLPRKRRWALQTATGAVLALALFFSRSYEDHVLATEKHAEVRRDYAASVLSYGEGLGRLLCVNGIGMTTLTTTTKVMAHLPLAFHEGPRTSALIICFGMGTTFRSVLSWDIETTAVELVPSVKNAFGFFHADSARFVHQPKGRIIVDDGRRYLRRTSEKFDVIVLDPPPPLEAAGSSLLYSEVYYTLAKARLKPKGIIQAWFPGSEDTLAAGAMFRSVHNSFPYVRCFDGVDGYGKHLIASMDSLPILTGAQLAARMPAAAQKDLLEWSPTADLPVCLERLVSQSTAVEDILYPDPEIRITDDRPYNEYFLLRRLDLF
jgi:spermidine synthase/predicted MFS family arabinose efflux permease